MTPRDHRLLDEQIAYYRARAAEYDEWFFRTGRYDRGPEHRAEWQAEISRIEQALEREMAGANDVLELACGTGLWTRHLANWARHVVAVDASPEVTEINRSRVGSDRVEYVLADLFAWQPSRSAFDVVFFGFWLSHVPLDRFADFWSTVRTALKPGGRACWVDSLMEPASTARDQAPLNRTGVVHRRLNDGREFRVVKVFHDPADLEQRLSRLGLTGWVRSSGRFFHYGCVSAAG